MIIVPPEADLVTRLDPELISQRLWDDNLTLGADTVSHTHKYNLASLSLLGMCNRGSDTCPLAPYSSGRAEAFVQRVFHVDGRRHRCDLLADASCGRGEPGVGEQRRDCAAHRGRVDLAGLQRDARSRPCSRGGVDELIGGLGNTQRVTWPRPGDRVNRTRNSVDPRPGSLPRRSTGSCSRHRRPGPDSGIVVPHHPRLREGLRDAVVMPDADLPKIAAPAVRALASIGITRLDQVANQSESELLALHGFGPRALRILNEALEARGQSLRP